MIFFLALLLSVLPAHADDVHPTLDELEVMASQKNWGELVFRLDDVPTAQRNDRWEKLVERGALGYLEMLSAEGMTGVMKASSEMLRKFPLLHRSKDFMTQRNSLGLSEIDACYSLALDGEDCSRQLFDFVKEDGEDTELAVKAARLAAEKQSVTASLPFLQFAINDATRRKVCGDAKVKELVLEALALPRGPSREVAVELAGRECWPYLKDDVMKALRAASPSASHFTETACPLVKRHSPHSRMPSACTRR